jgi:CDGSH iron-sulfur domain-containing protein 3
VAVLQRGDQGVRDGLAAERAHRPALAEAHHAVVRGHYLAHLRVIEAGYALHLLDNDGMDKVVIKVRHNGPYKVTGPVTIIDADGSEYDLSEFGDSVVLCRCGASTTKPFCDKTHSKIGFEAAERAVRETG